MAGHRNSRKGLESPFFIAKEVMVRKTNVSGDSHLEPTPKAFAGVSLGASAELHGDGRHEVEAVASDHHDFHYGVKIPPFATRRADVVAISAPEPHCLPPGLHCPPLDGVVTGALCFAGYKVECLACALVARFGFEYDCEGSRYLGCRVLFCSG